MNYENIEVERRDAVTMLTLNRPNRLNAPYFYRDPSRQPYWEEPMKDSIGDSEFPFGWLLTLSPRIGKSCSWLL